MCSQAVDEARTTIPPTALAAAFPAASAICSSSGSNSSPAIGRTLPRAQGWVRLSAATTGSGRMAEPASEDHAVELDGLYRARGEGQPDRFAARGHIGPA